MPLAWRRGWDDVDPNTYRGIEDWAEYYLVLEEIDKETKDNKTNKVDPTGALRGLISDKLSFGYMLGGGQFNFSHEKTGWMPSSNGTLWQRNSQSTNSLNL